MDGVGEGVGLAKGKIESVFVKVYGEVDKVREDFLLDCEIAEGHIIFYRKSKISFKKYSKIMSKRGCCVGGVIWHFRSRWTGWNKAQDFIGMQRGLLAQLRGQFRR